MCAGSSVTHRFIACKALHLPSRWYAALPATKRGEFFVCALGDGIGGSAGRSALRTLSSKHRSP